LNSMSDDDLKEAMREVWIAGYKKGYHVEEYRDHTIRTASNLFDRWWEANAE